MTTATRKSHLSNTVPSSPFHTWTVAQAGELRKNILKKTDVVFFFRPKYSVSVAFVDYYLIKTVALQPQTVIQKNTAVSRNSLSEI